MAGGAKIFFRLSPPTPLSPYGLGVFDQTRCWLDRYFAGQRPSPDELPLYPHGSAFRQTVWRCLCRIPYGTVTTYGAIAHEVSFQLGVKTMSAQAVGGAIGHNPISIIIPCHRVIGANGRLTGYAGGLEKKYWLLSHEGLTISSPNQTPQTTKIC